MAFDGITTACLCKELSDRLTGARVYKIAQTDRDELVLTLKPTAECGGGQCRLYLSADASLPLAYFTAVSRQAPLQAPAFCMLLRKHLQNGRILSVTQPGLERILRFEVEHLDEMGDLCRHTLVIELMGKHSNIIVLDDKEQIPPWSVPSGKYFRAGPILSPTRGARRTRSRRARTRSIRCCGRSRSLRPGSCSPPTREFPRRWPKSSATARGSPTTGAPLP